MSLRYIWKTSGHYSTAKERAYYAGARPDTVAIPYEHLDAYLTGSVGADFFRGKSVLDLGCGEGVYSAWIADRGNATEVLGIELTEHRIRREYERNLKNLRFVGSDFLQFDLQGKNFEVVFMNLVLHHVRFVLTDAINVVKRALKPGGVFLAFEPNVYSPFAMLAHILHDRSANEGFLSPKRVRSELERARFEEITTGYFWRDRRWARNPLLGSSFWITARKSRAV